MEIKMDMLEKLDATLTERLNDHSQIDAESLIRFCYPVIRKHREAGLKIESVALALQEMGYKVTKGHLVRHLGKIMREQAAVKWVCQELGQETAMPAVVVSADTAVFSRHRHEQAGVPVSDSSSRKSMLESIPSSGWELETRDDLIPAELLKLAFVEIAGKTYDVRQPMPIEFGDPREAARDQVNPDSPNWSEYRAKSNHRGEFERGRRLVWRPSFEKWLVEQGYMAIAT